MPALHEGMDPLLVSNLRASGVPTITKASAEAQQIPTTTVVLANMMPAKVMEATEVQWGEQYCTEPNVAVAVELAKFDDDCREGEDETGRTRSRTENLKRYKEI